MCYFTLDFKSFSFWFKSRNVSSDTNCTRREAFFFHLEQRLLLLLTTKKIACYGSLITPVFFFALKICTLIHRINHEKVRIRLIPKMRLL
ncbi:hypothetical protein BD408DRAFT_423110, partial [Parasitella parasitica]